MNCAVAAAAAAARDVRPSLADRAEADRGTPEPSLRDERLRLERADRLADLGVTCTSPWRDPTLDRRRRGDRPLSERRTPHVDEPVPAVAAASPGEGTEPPGLPFLTAVSVCSVGRSASGVASGCPQDTCRECTCHTPCFVSICVHRWFRCVWMFRRSFASDLSNALSDTGGRSTQPAYTAAAMAAAVAGWARSFWGSKALMAAINSSAEPTCGTLRDWVAMRPHASSSSASGGRKLPAMGGPPTAISKLRLTTAPNAPAAQ